MLKYRPEIDGLRALSVIFVILFHAGLSDFSGGFVGVDVFFVISGYLVGSIIYKKIKNNDFNLIGFYIGRMRRLSPALFLVCFFVIVFSFFLFENKDFRDSLRSVTSSILIVSNWFFITKLDYFNPEGESFPLLHTWSLSIEEQFYFVFPFLLIFLVRVVRSNYLPYLFLFFSLISFFYSQHLIDVNLKNDAYLNTFSRVGEILIGVSLALFNFKKINNKVAINAIEISSLLAIIIPVFLISKNSDFPGFMSLIPVLGSGAFLVYGGAGWVSNLISKRIFVYLGLISYSLYLWHWPIFTFVKYVNPNYLKENLLFFIILIFAVSCLSFHFIEKPIREKRILENNKKFITIYVMSFLFLLLMSFALISNKKVNSFRAVVYESVFWLIYKDASNVLNSLTLHHEIYQTKKNLNYSGKSVGEFNDDFIGYTCSFDGGNSVERVLNCITKQAKEKNYLVLGDSIGRDLMRTMQKIKPDINFIMLHQSSCPPFIEYERCVVENDSLFKELFEKINVEKIIIAFSHWNRHDFEKINNGLLRIKAYEKDVTFVGVMPVLNKEMKDLVISDKNIINRKKTPLDSLAFNPFEKEDSMDAMAKNIGIDFIKVASYFCDTDGCNLWVDDDLNKPLYFDNQHLSIEGMDFFGKRLSSTNIFK